MADKIPAAQGDTKAAGDTSDATKGQTPEQKAAADKATADATTATEKAAADAKTAATAEAVKAAEAETARKAEAAAASKAPVKYVLALPDGSADYLDAGDLTDFEKVAKAEGWTNEEAQAVLEAQATSLKERAAQFRAETAADETYGGEHLADTQRLASLVMDKFAPAGVPLHDELRRDLLKSGYGNKLAVVSLLARIGKMMAEDQPGPGGRAGDSSGAKDIASVLYPTMAKG